MFKKSARGVFIGQDLNIYVKLAQVSGSESATESKHAIAFSAYECLTYHYRILACRVWAKVLQAICVKDILPPRRDWILNKKMNPLFLFIQQQVSPQSMGL